MFRPVIAFLCAACAPSGAQLGCASTPVVCARFPVPGVTARGVEQALALLVPAVQKGERWTSSPSLALHAALAHDHTASFLGPMPDKAAILRAVTDNKESKRIFGRELMLPTPYGLRVRGSQLPLLHASAADESHCDQVLAMLGALGVEPEFRVAAAEQPHTVGDLVRDMLANTRESQADIEWTVMAAAAYLRGGTWWRNRFGEEVSLERLTDRLISEDPTMRPCHGTHVFEALAAICRYADRGLLSAQTRRRALGRVRVFVAAAVASQSADGWWDGTWYTGGGPGAADPLTRLSTTSHLAQRLLELPPGVDMPGDTVSQAARWIAIEIARIHRAETAFEIQCPFTHALLVLKATRESP